MYIEVQNFELEGLAKLSITLPHKELYNLIEMLGKAEEGLAPTLSVQCEDLYWDLKEWA